MGWDYTSKSSTIPMFAFFSLLMDYKREDRYFKVLDCHTHNENETYLLCESYSAKDNKIIRMVTVVLTKYVDGMFNFGYKYFGEDSGPYQYNCPLSFIKRCTEPTNGYSANWRLKVRENHAARKDKKARIAA